MRCPIMKNLKIYGLAGLVALVSGGALGNINSSFAENTTDADIIMTIDVTDSFGDEAEVFNNVLNVFTAAFLGTNGNIEIVAMDRNTICISARSDSRGCSHKASRGLHQVVIDAESYDAGRIIFLTYDE